MLIGQYSIILAIVIILLCIYFLKLKNLENKTNVLLRILSIILAIVFFFRYMLGDDALSNTIGLKNTQFQNPVWTAISLILNWFIYAINLLIILYPFFKNSKYATVIKYCGFVIGLLSVGFLFIITIGIVGSTAYSIFNIRSILLSIEIALIVVYSFIIFWENGKFKVTKSDAWGFVYFVGMLLATMPTYMLQGLFGFVEKNYEFKDLKIPHRIILYISILLPICLYFLLKNKDKETIRGILLYISLGTLLSFSLSFKFQDFADITRWPFHLCNTAMYIIPLCLIFKWDKLFYFTYFINVLGAFLAMAMPNYSDGINMFSNGILRFYVNHYIAFFMPILMVALRIYERPKLKQFKYSMVGFGIYFVLVLILNAWFSNYGSVDYFFINSDFIVSKLGDWARRTMDYEWVFNIGDLIFKFYPLYQFLFFVVYLLLGLGVWFIYEQGYAFVDMLKDMYERNKKINLDKLALEIASSKKSGEQKMSNKIEAKIKLNNFSKCYGSSKEYAVQDANLEINGGEIFGFLGHNGAGKSTIIKSIVGIQPITSGSIEVCGYDVEKQPVMAKRNIGFVPDHYALYEKLTGREYINYIADLYDVSVEDRNKSIEKYVKLFELQGAFDNQIKTYSHGMKQKITIMSALVHNPKVWILDEPLTGLDPTSIFQVKECMRQHAKEGNIVFFSSHIIDVVESICDRIAIIKKGKILTVKSLKEIEKECSLEEFYMKINNNTLKDKEKSTKTRELMSANKN